ncbi:uncharacterized protein LOC130698095 [Daphnia carinata]|uniref:uncharacterized protein LOC130698095 n=1 Tax=Daphnia carinata TaxID=120202 RepID=UPI00257B128B|nr:uncharacterized protein LOC130698095 [Daphnia carinata]
MKCLYVFLIVVCVPAIYSAPTSNSPRNSQKRAAAAQAMDTVSLFEVHDLTGVDHDDIPDDIEPFEVVNIDGHTLDTLPKNIIPVEVIPAQNSADVFEVHNLDGMSHDDIPDDLSVFEVVDISKHTADTLPRDVIPVHITPIGTVAGASAISRDGSAVFADASAGLNTPGGVARTGMSRVKVVPASHVSHIVYPVDNTKYISATVRGPYVPKVKCRQADLFPYRGPSEGLFKYFSDIVREELSDCMIGGVVVRRR